MKARTFAVVLMAALAYEVLVKLGRFAAPDLFHASAVMALTALMLRLTLAAGLLFLVLFAREEFRRGWAAAVAWGMVGCLAARLLLKLPAGRTGSRLVTIRLLDHTVGLCFAVLALALLLLYRRLVPTGARGLARATTLLIVMLGVGVASSLLSVAGYARFLASGVETAYPPALSRLMVGVFLLTHAAMIAFLFCYFRFKRAAIGSGGNDGEGRHEGCPDRSGDGCAGGLDPDGR